MSTVKAQRSQPTPAGWPGAAGPVVERPPQREANYERVPEFEQVVEQQQANVARLVARLLGWPAGAADVDDVVQDVFLAVLKALPTFRGQSSVATWVTRITINACRSHRRTRLLRLAFLRRWLRHAAQSHDQAQTSQDEREETRRRVRQAVGGLPNRYREVVVLRYLQGMDVDEIGRVLGLTRGATEVRLHRARALLKDELRPLMDER